MGLDNAGKTTFLGWSEAHTQSHSERPLSDTTLVTAERIKSTFNDTPEVDPASIAPTIGQNSKSSRRQGLTHSQPSADTWPFPSSSHTCQSGESPFRHQSCSSGISEASSSLPPSGQPIGLDIQRVLVRVCIRGMLVPCRSTRHPINLAKVLLRVSRRVFRHRLDRQGADRGMLESVW
jgi:hypothetical protein